jgi:phosphatidylglycerophosphate synthase
LLDGIARRLVDPALDRIGRALARRGVGADALTFAGLATGLGGAVLVALDALGAALALVLLSRALDGLDGAVARASRPTDRGGFLDITCDFAFYGAVPLAFAVRDPAHALPAAGLLFAFYVNGATFLAFAAVAAKRGLATTGRGPKSIAYTAGLAEGTETIAVFALMCLVPAWFPGLAWGFAALTLATAIARGIMAWSAFRDGEG